MKTAIINKYMTIKTSTSEHYIRADMIESLKSRTTFELICHPEETELEGNASAIDPETDRSTERYILEDLEAGNQWAWCTVQVKATFEGFEGSDYLGCCSYASRDDFESDGQFQDMKDRAFEEMVLELLKAEKAVRKAWSSL